MPFCAKIFAKAKDQRGFYIEMMLAPLSMQETEAPSQLVQSSSKQIIKKRYSFRAETVEKCEQWLKHLGSNVSQKTPYTIQDFSLIESSLESTWDRLDNDEKSRATTRINHNKSAILA